MKAIDNYSNVMTKAINSNILTNQALNTSSLCLEYWLASEALAKAIIRMNYSKTALVRELKCWDFDDLVSEFTYVLVKKFQAQIKAMLNPKPDENGITHAHNHNAYTTTIFKNFLNDNLKRYEVKKKVIDENNKEHYISVNVTTKDANGNDVKAYWSHVYTSTPISDDANSLTLEDTLTSDAYAPEATVIKRAEESDAKKESFEHLKTMCKMKTYLGPAYVYIEDKLIENCIPCSLESILELFNNIESKSPAFRLAAQRTFVKAYNADLVAFVDFVSDGKISDDRVDFILTNYGKTFNDFGRNFHIDKEKISHLRDEWKKAIYKIKGIEVPKKFKKKISK